MTFQRIPFSVKFQVSGEVSSGAGVMSGDSQVPVYQLALPACGGQAASPRAHSE